MPEAATAQRRRRAIEFLYNDDCPSYPEAWATLQKLLTHFDIDATVERRLVETQADAARLRFPGSPTIRIDGIDVDPAGAEARASLACRIYRRPDGSTMPAPSREMLIRALKLSLAPGEPAPDFALLGVDGRTHRLSDYAASPVLVLVQYSNHCPYVQAWEPRLVRFARDHAPRGVATIAICSNDPDAYPEDAFDQMAARSRDRSFPFDYLHDPDQVVAMALGATRTPEVFVFDSERRLAYHGLIDDNRDDAAGVVHAYLREAVAALLSEPPSPPPVADTPPQGCFVKWKW